jgi:hypothetical protein
MTAFKKFALLAVASAAGVSVGTVVATPVIATMNYLATDGPIFPPFLVAFGLLALPIGFLLLIIQTILVSFELVFRRLLSRGLLPLALVAGLSAGVFLALALDPLRPSPAFLLALALFGVIQALTVFALHWVANKSQFAAPHFPELKQPGA